MSYELLFNLLLIAVGIFILIRSGMYVAKSLVNIANFLNTSKFTLSFILMAFATTLPEFGIGVNSALSGNPSLSLGNILGANILTLSLTLGLVALISGKIALADGSVAHRTWMNFAIGVSPLVFLIDGGLSRFEGIILLVLFFLHLARLFHIKEFFHHRRSFWLSFINHFENRSDGLNLAYFFKNAFVFVSAVFVLLASAFLVVKGSKAISELLDVSEILIGMFAIALGTTLPELSFGLRAAFTKNEDLSLGNLFGASVFNSTWILGIVALISPIKIASSASFWFSALMMILVLFLANLFLNTRNEINRREGFLLVAIYLVFSAVQIVNLF